MTMQNNKDESTASGNTKPTDEQLLEVAYKLAKEGNMELSDSQAQKMLVHPLFRDKLERVWGEFQEKVEAEAKRAEEEELNKFFAVHDNKVETERKAREREQHRADKTEETINRLGPLVASKKDLFMERFNASVLPNEIFEEQALCLNLFHIMRQTASYWHQAIREADDEYKEYLSLQSGAIQSRINLLEKVLREVHGTEKVEHDSRKVWPFANNSNEEWRKVKYQIIGYIVGNPDWKFFNGFNRVPSVEDWEHGNSSKAASAETKAARDWAGFVTDAVSNLLTGLEDSVRETIVAKVTKGLCVRYYQYCQRSHEVNAKTMLWHYAVNLYTEAGRKGSDSEALLERALAVASAIGKSEKDLQCEVAHRQVKSDKSAAEASAKDAAAKDAAAKRSPKAKKTNGKINGKSEGKGKGKKPPQTKGKRARKAAAAAAGKGAK